MNKDSNTFSKEEIFRLYEQSEFSDIIDDDNFFYKRIKKIRSVKNKFPLFYTLLGVGVVAGFLSVIKKK
jgi:hypothetical protein